MLGLSELDRDLEGRDREHAAPLHSRGGGGARRLTPRTEPHDPLLVALDAAGLSCSAAVAKGGRVLAVRDADLAHGQAEALMPMVAAAMVEAGLAPAALDLVAATVGPGSFTGIRAGLAAARGIALALEKPLLGVTSFEAAAALDDAAFDDRGGGGFLLVALESRRREIFIQLFDPARQPLAGPAALAPEMLADWVEAAVGSAALRIAGDAARRAAAALSARPCLRCAVSSAPSAVGVARAALRRWRAGERHGNTQPLYLRSPDVTVSSGNRGPTRV